MNLKQAAVGRQVLQDHGAVGELLEGCPEPWGSKSLPSPTCLPSFSEAAPTVCLGVARPYLFSCPFFAVSEDKFLGLFFFFHFKY